MDMVCIIKYFVYKMQQVINKVKEIVKGSFEAEIETYEGLTSRIVVSNGASEGEINKCNSYFNNKLPEDYLMFLQNYNGSTFFKVSDISGFKFWSCEELIQQNSYHKGNLGKDWDERIILICTCMGDGDYIGIRVHNSESYEIIDCFGEETPANWNSIGNSFSDFLRELIDQRGKRFWM
jgi:hypothetical protein